MKCKKSFAHRSLLISALVLSIQPLAYASKIAGVAPNSSKPIKRTPSVKPSLSLPQLDLQNAIPNRVVRFVGFATKGIAILIAETSYSSNKGELVRWDISRHKIVGSIPLSQWFWTYLLTLSPDGGYTVTTNNFMGSSFPDAKAYKITVLDSSSLTTTQTIDVGAKKNCVGFLFLPNQPTYAIAKKATEIPILGTDDSVDGNAHFEWLNLTTGKVEKTLYYNPARGCDKILQSSGEKYLACLFTDEKFDLLDDKLERSGIVDILDFQTGKILWHIRGSQKQPAGDPFFFISPTQFVSSDTVFDIATKTAKPWSAVNASRQCLAAISNHSDYALFWTPKGVELRNWKANRTLRRWPTLVKPGRVLFSPDLKMFSFKRDQNIQFWKFDAAWLK